MSTPFVRAVLVTDSLSPFADDVFAALGALDPAPSRLDVVAVGETIPALPAGLDAVVHHRPGLSFARAVADAVASVPARDNEVLWLLHDDTAPRPDALGRLLATLAKRRRAALVGAAHTRWNDASRLVNMGTTVSSLGARRIGLVVEDDINQGQHDWREDVFAVSLAGAAVRREAWEDLGGLDDGYQGFGESVEFCHRAWAAGWDVVIEPSAVVRHAQAGLYGVRAEVQGRSSSHLARRVGEWHHAFAWASLPVAFLLALMVPASAALRVVVRLAHNSPSAALADLMVPVALARRIPAIARTRASHRAIGATGAVPSRLLAGPRQVADAVRQRELGGFETLRAARVPSEMVRAELSRAAARHRRSLVVTLLAGLGASVALSWGLMRAVMGGAMLAAPGLGATNAGLGEIWTRASEGWSEAGLGSPAIDGAFAMLMLPLAVMPGGLRVWVAVLLLGAPLIAAIAAWLALGAATRGALVRSVLALTYALWPPFIESVLQGRVGAVLAHVAIALGMLAVAKTMGWSRGELMDEGEERDAPRPSASASSLAALAWSVATVAQPVLMLPFGVAVAVLVWRTPREVRARWWAVAVVPTVLFLPTLVAAARHLGQPVVAASILAREPGPGGGSGQSAVQVLFGSQLSDALATPLSAVAWGAVALAALGATVLIALVMSPAWRAVAAGVALVGLGAGTAALSQASTAAYADPVGRQALGGWPGAGLSLVAAGLVVAVAAAHGEALARRSGVVRSLAAAGAGLSLAALALVAAGALGPHATATTITAIDPHVLPLAVPLDQQGELRQRVALISRDAQGAVSVVVLASDGSSTIAGRADLGPDGAPLSGGVPHDMRAIEEAAAALVASAVADTTTLSDWGISAVVLSPGSEELRGALDQNAALSLVSASERGLTYRVAGEPVSRAWLDVQGERTPLTSTAASGEVTRSSGDAATLIVATPAGGGWRAWGDGEELSLVQDDKGRVAFAVPSGARHIDYAYQNRLLGWWWWLSAAAVLVTALGALPWRRPVEVLS